MNAPQKKKINILPTRIKSIQRKQSLLCYNWAGVPAIQENLRCMLEERRESDNVGLGLSGQAILPDRQSNSTGFDVPLQVHYITLIICMVIATSFLPN